MSDENKSFVYSYSANEQAEIKRIRAQYIETQAAEPDKMEQLRRLDAGVTKKGTVVSLVLGIFGTLILGTGMSLIMSDLRHALGLQESFSIIGGILIGVLGIILVALAYPVYVRITKQERARIAPEILRLTDELLK